MDSGMPLCATSMRATPLTKTWAKCMIPKRTSSRSFCKSRLVSAKRSPFSGTTTPTPDGTCVRDYIHVLDLASTHILALRALDQGSRTYNLGNGKGFSVAEVIETARKITGHPIPAAVGARRPGDPATLIASSDKIMEELGWEPRYPDLRQIIEMAWSWHVKHSNGYEE